MRHLGARSGPECVNYRPRGDRLRVFEDLFGVNGDDDDADRDDDADADDVEKSVDHAASTVADLLVESGRFPHSGAALDHLLNSRHGNALLGRLHKAAKGETMRGDNLESILKDCGPVRLCKGIVERQRSPCTEAELVAVLTKHAGGDRAFAKLCETEPNVLRACSIAKAAEFAAFDDTPMVVGGADARDVDNATAAVRAYEEIVRIGREKFPFLRADQQFARVMEDKNYAALAAQAHQRPSPSTVYAMPRSSPGSTYAKADPAPSADTAYAALVVKAREHRAAHPELTEAQAFAVVYSDRANVELAKRERIESAPR